MDQMDDASSSTISAVSLPSIDYPSSLPCQYSRLSASRKFLINRRSVFYLLFMIAYTDFLDVEFVQVERFIRDQFQIFLERNILDVKSCFLIVRVFPWRWKRSLSNNLGTVIPSRTLLLQIVLILFSIPDEYRTVAECTYTLSMDFHIADRKTYPHCSNWGTAIAISPHYLITVAHTVHWLTKLRGLAYSERVTLKLIPR